MVEFGYEAELVIGISDPSLVPLARDAWVTYIDDGEQRRVLIEPSEKDAERSMLRYPQPNADYYWPQVGVQHTGEMFGYTGMIRGFRIAADLPWHADEADSPSRQKAS